MRPRSEKVKRSEPDFRRVYAQVDARSDGQCEVWTALGNAADAESALRGSVSRCLRRAVEHHHLYKPRRSHHDAGSIVHICRACHDRADWPYHRGRLVHIATAAVTPAWWGHTGPAFLFAIRFASSKFALRGQGD